ncbi:MAG TPA: PIN domain-containing protein [Conexivisphaerales archaeon]|nr:PIN domain-containing protein [Conexivisphaerales archaeon]
MLDTRFFVAHTFPPSGDDQTRLNRFVARISGDQMYASSISVTEFLKVAGPRIGKEGAKARMRAWTSNGLQIAPVDEEVAFSAGELAIAFREIPLGDTLIGATAQLLKAPVASDDPDFRKLGVKTIWYR